jgi:hypothetical protein
MDDRLWEKLERQGWKREVICEGEDGPVVGWSYLEKEHAPLVYLSAGIHGDEPAGPLAVKALLDGGLSLEWNWLVCPMLNPSGFARGTRSDALGRDLNRDYFFRESLEVRSHVAWMEKFPIPTLMISLHEDWEATGFYFYEINQCEDRPERARRLLQAVEGVMQIEPLLIVDDHPVRESGWIYHEPSADFPDNWPEAIYMAERGCPLSLTLETPSMAFPLETRVAALRVAVLEMLKWWKENQPSA